MIPESDDPLGDNLRSRQLVAEALADKISAESLHENDRAFLGKALEKAVADVWDARQRIFARDATGQDEEVFYERYALSGASYTRNDAGEYIGLM